MRSKETVLKSKISPKDTILIVTKENIRTLPIHNAKPRKANGIVMNTDELSHIKDSAQVWTLEQIEEMKLKFNAEKEAMNQRALERKQRMEEYDSKRQGNAGLNDLEQEAKEKAQYLLAKAQKQLDEQEDEIKHMNELILNAKCVAIRDLQIEEKKMIKAQMQEEEARLDAIMEMNRVEDLKRIRERELKRAADMKVGASMIQKQIEDRREAALMEQERKDNETKQLLKALQEKEELEIKAKQDKVRKQRGLMQQVAEYNRQTIELRNQKKQQEMLEDKKILEYILAKEKLAEEKEKELDKKKSERERELALLRAAQKRMSDKQAQQDALRAQRAQESYERDWRRKEKEAAEKQARLEADLKQSRVRQQLEKEQAIAMEAYMMRQEFVENIQRQKQIESKMTAEKEQKKHSNLTFSKDIKHQIAGKEEQRKKERENFFAEAIKTDEERKERLAKIQKIKEQKIQELKKLGVPEKYCVDIIRKIKT